MFECQRPLLRYVLAAGALLVLAAPAMPRHAQDEPEALATASRAFVADASGPSCAQREAFWQGLQARFESVRADLTRTALETMLTMFFIRSSPGPTTPPPTSTPTPPPSPPPPVNNTPPPPSKPPPPPPSGQGDPPTNVDPPPPTAPEPAGIIVALVGCGFAAAWRFRRRR